MQRCCQSFAPHLSNICPPRICVRRNLGDRVEQLLPDSPRPAEHQSHVVKGILHHEDKSARLGRCRGISQSREPVPALAAKDSPPHRHVRPRAHAPDRDSPCRPPSTSCSCTSRRPVRAPPNASTAAWPSRTPTSALSAGTILPFLLPLSASVRSPLRWFCRPAPASSICRAVAPASTTTTPTWKTATVSD